MKTLLFVIAILVLSTAIGTTAWGQLLTENFEYTSSTDLAGQGPWAIIGTNYANNLNVSSSGLTYTGYTGSGVGNAATLIGASSSDDLGAGFTSQSTGTIYYSFMVQVANTASSGGYFTALNTGQTATNYTGRIYVRVVSGNVNFGLAKGTETVTYGSTNYSPNTTYVIVLKYELIAGTTNDKVSIFVFDSTIPSTEPGTPEVGPLQPSTTDQSALAGVMLRQDGSVAATVTIDGLRIGTSWSSIFPPIGINQPPSISNVSRVTFVPATGATDSVKATITDDHTVSSATLHVRVNGGNYDSSLTMTVLSGTTYHAVIPAGKHTTNGDLVEYFISAIDDSSAYTSTALQGYFVGDSRIDSIKAHPLTSIAGYGARVNGTLNARTNLFSNGSGNIQDASGGLKLYMSGMPLLQAERNAKVEGTIASYFNAYEMTTPNFSFVDTGLGTSTVTPATITLPTTHSASYVNEGKLVKIVTMSTDSTGTFAASKNYVYREADTDSIIVRVESNGAANTVVGKTIKSTPVDVIGILSFYLTYQEVKPRGASDMGLNEGDGTGTASITPTSRFSSISPVAETLTVAGDGTYTLEGVSVTIPSSWTWTGNAAHVAFTGSGTPSTGVTGNGSAGNPWVIAITGVSITNVSTGTIIISNLGTPSSLGSTTFNVKTRITSGTFASIASSPTVNIVGGFEAIQTGDWNVGSTWSGGIVPGAGDNVTMTTTGVVVSVTNTGATCNNLTMNGGTDTTKAGPTLQFATSGTSQLTINGRLDITSGSGYNRNNRPKLTSNGNADATLIAKGYIFTDVSNTVQRDSAGLNMNEGTVKLLGSTSDTLKTGAGFRLANLTIGDGSNAKTFLWHQTSSGTMNIRSLTIKHNSSFICGGTANTYANPIGNHSATDVPMLNGGVVIEDGASFTVNNASGGTNNGNLSINGGGISNSGTLNLRSDDGSRKYNILFGYVDLTGSKQTVGGTAVGAYANVTIGTKDSVTLNQQMNLDTLFVDGFLIETDGHVAVGYAKTTRTVAQATDEIFGGIGLTINAADAAPGATTVMRRTGFASTGGGNSSILRYFDISPATNSGLNATLDFYFDNSELNGQNATTLGLWKSIDAGANWTSQGGTVDIGLRKVHLTAIDGFSRWTASDANHPLTIVNVTRQYHMNARWNIISVPLTVPDYSISVLFPTSNLQAWAYIGGYQSRTVLDNGSGYWLKFGSSQDVSITGGLRQLDTVDLVKGWNMIGTISSQVLVSAIEKIPSDLVLSVFYGYEGGYQKADTLFPGKGYWVKASALGKIVLTSGSLLKTIGSADDGMSDLNSLTITDVEGNHQTLYFGVNQDGKTTADLYDLPPLPPAGIFDARFQSHRYMETYPIEVKNAQEYPIAVQSSSQVTVSWHIASVGDHQFILTDDAKGQNNLTQSLTGNGKITLSNAVKTLILKVADREKIPTEFMLGSNYPNPFNPSTRFVIAVPKTALVDVSIYDILGRKIKTLFNEEKAAGYHTIEWNGLTNNGNPAGSGIFFVRMVSEKFSATRKIVMMK